MDDAWVTLNTLEMVLALENVLACTSHWACSAAPHGGALYGDVVCGGATRGLINKRYFFMHCACVRVLLRILSVGRHACRCCGCFTTSERPLIFHSTLRNTCRLKTRNICSTFAETVLTFHRFAHFHHAYPFPETSATCRHAYHLIQISTQTESTPIHPLHLPHRHVPLSLQYAHYCQRLNF